jgi:hypothetical protein
MKHLKTTNNRKRGKNALRHGAYSREFVLHGEDLTAFRHLQAEIERDLLPEGPLQRELALSVTTWVWRRRRVNKAARIRELVAGGGQEDGEAAINPSDPAAVDQLIAKAADFRSRYCAIKLCDALIRWAVSATASASSHMHLNLVVSELGSTFGIDASLYGQNVAPTDLELRKKRLTMVIQNLSNQTKAFAEKELARADAAVRESIGRVFPVDLRAEIELAGRIDAELERATKRYFQLKIMQSTVNRMSSDPRQLPSPVDSHSPAVLVK